MTEKQEQKKPNKSAELKADTQKSATKVDRVKKYLVEKIVEGSTHGSNPKY